MTEQEVDLIEELVVNWIVRSKNGQSYEYSKDDWGSKKRIEKIKRQLIKEIKNEGS